MSAAALEAPNLSGPSEQKIPMTRLITVELRSMFNTRAGFWLMVSVAIVVVLATIGVALFVADSDIEYGSFSAAIGFPLSLVLPVIAILSMTSEWSQRTGLLTFALEPRRGRSIGAKAIACVMIAIGATVLSLAVGAVGNVAGAAIAGIDTVWNIGAGDMSKLTLNNVIGLMQGFAFGVLIRSSAGAIVAYFVYTFALTTITTVLAEFQDWFRDVRAWVDFGFAQEPLFNLESVSGERWAQIAVSGSFWLLLPLLVGTWLVLRAEVK